MNYIKLIEKYRNIKNKSIKEEVLYDLIYQGYTEEDAKKEYEKLKKIAKAGEINEYCF